MFCDFGKALDGIELKFYLFSVENWWNLGCRSFEANFEKSEENLQENLGILDKIIIKQLIENQSFKLSEIYIHSAAKHLYL